jgi:two-component system, NtrC family, nitrogen regulation response regulator GlnG
MTAENKILIVDDEENIRWVFAQALEEKPLTVHTAGSAEEALEKMTHHNYLLVFTDIFMPGMGGMDLLDHIKSQQPHTHVIVMTAQDTMNNTILAMRKGAYDYISKPFDFNEIYELIDKVTASSQVTPPQEDEVPVGNRDFSMDDIVGKSKAMQDIFKTIGKAAVTQLPVLITGESGTGKEMVARALHFYSDRSKRPFICINCAAISRELLESELFGHEKGAFTGAVEAKKGKFELADNGTVLLDEIGDMEIALQAKILRVLQNNEFYRVGGKEPLRVDVRVIAATNQNLPELMDQKRFREDLYHRLNVINIHLPPLRERAEDIPLLANFFLKKYSEELTRGQVFLSPQVEQALKNYRWSGNIRELENVIKRGMVLASTGPLVLEHLPLNLQAGLPAPEPEDITWDAKMNPLVKNFLNDHFDSGKGQLHDLLIETVEKHLFEQLLEKNRGNQVATAKDLGINRNTLKRKIDAMNIEPKKKKEKPSY